MKYVSNNISCISMVFFSILKFCLKDQKLTAACSGKSKCISLDIFVGEEIWNFLLCQRLAWIYLNHSKPFMWLTSGPTLHKLLIHIFTPNSFYYCFNILTTESKEKMICRQIEMTFWLQVLSFGKNKMFSCSKIYI